MSDSVKKSRSKRLSGIIEEITGEIFSSYIGRRVRGLVVERGFRGNSLVARLDNYFPLVLPYEEGLLGRRVEAEVEEATFFDLRGKIMEVF